MLKIHFYGVPLWSILVCKIAQFLAKSYHFRQLVTLFQKVDTLRLLKICSMFCSLAGAKYPFFKVQLMDYTFHSQDQRFLMRCSFSDSNHQMENGQMETESKSASEHSKTLFFVNIKNISIKEVNLSTKGHRHILKD